MCDGIELHCSVGMETFFIFYIGFVWCFIAVVELVSVLNMRYVPFFVIDLIPKRSN